MIFFSFLVSVFVVCSDSSVEYFYYRMSEAKVKAFDGVLYKQHVADTQN